MLLRKNQAILGTALVFGTDAGFAWIGVIFGSLASSSLTFRCSLGREMRDGFIGPLSHAEAKSVCDPNQIASYKISTESDGFRCRSEWPTALQFRHKHNAQPNWEEFPVLQTGFLPFSFVLH